MLRRLHLDAVATDAASTRRPGTGSSPGGVLSLSDGPVPV